MQNVNDSTSVAPMAANTSVRSSVRRILGLALVAGTFAASANAATTVDVGSLTKESVKTSFPILNLQPYLYATKFVCGQQLNAGVQIGQDVTYAALEPGVYSTALNILTLKRDAPGIAVRASMDGFAPVTVASQLSSASAFDTHTLTCDEILDAFNAKQPGRDAYEGFLYLQRQRPDLRVDTVYTYASQDEEEVLWGVTEKGNVIRNPETNVISVGGGKGIGLGASIDIERVDPVNLDDI